MASNSDVPGTAPPEEWPTLPDRWAREGLVVLDGPLAQRAVRSPASNFAMGFGALVAAFVLFQVLITPLVLVAQIGASEGGMSALQSMGTAQVLATYTRELIISNSVGQVLGLAGTALLFARLHTSRVGAFLRVRGVDVQLLVLAVGGVVALQPVVQWLAQLNQALPLPEAVRTFEETQLEMIRSVLESGMGVPFNLVMLALVPGICEELLFRGYVQREFERCGGGAWGGILLSGLFFGAYHFRPTQLLPLVVLGTYLAYITWRTGSIWPAILVHIVHNGLAVVMARYARSHPSYDMEALEQMAVPWYAVAGGFAILGGILYVFHPLARQIRES